MTRPSEKKQPSGTAWMMSLGPTRGEATVRDLRLFACSIEADRERELVQHAADMLEIAMRSLSTQSAIPAIPDGMVLIKDRRTRDQRKAGYYPYSYLDKLRRSTDAALDGSTKP